MAQSQKIEETGWFYHAPAKQQNYQEHDLPPASQIPGLSDLPEYEPEHPAMKKWIRDTDSKYVRMAKQGGRPGLIRWRSPKPLSEHPVSYPRPDWFYHDDVTEEETKQKKADFSLPEYMVHEEYQPEGTYFDAEKNRPKRLPYGYDRLSIYEREPGKKATDKKIRLPEKIQPGQMRATKPIKMTKNMANQPMAKKTCDHLVSSQPQYTPMPEMYSEKDKPVMGRIMSYNYGTEFDKELKKWQHKQGRPDMVSRPREKVQSEYQEQCAKVQQAQIKKTIKFDKKVSPRQEKKESPEKPLFKLSRFAKVAAKTDSHRPQVLNKNRQTQVHTYNQQLDSNYVSVSN